MLRSLALVAACTAAAIGPVVASGSGKGPHTHDDSFVPDYVLRGTYSANASIACTTRPSVLLNGTSPGPELRLQENKTTWVRVYNDMSDRNLTVHWHGLSASVAPFSDGTPLVSQWPIPPNHFFDYELHPDIGEAGTYFYHSHVGFQAVSAAGALIVEEADDCDAPYDYDEEKVMLITELYNKTDDRIAAGLLATPFVWSGEPNTFLVNGNAYAPANTTLSNSQCKPEIFEVEPSKTYRFRTVGAAALGYIVFEIEQHNSLSIIEADGAYTQPYNVSRIQAGSGQRFDFLLKTMSKDELAASKKTDFFIQVEDRLRPSTPVSYAILRYKSKGSKPSGHGSSASPAASIPPQPSSKPLNITKSDEEIAGWLEYALQPLEPNDFPTASEVTRRIVIDAQQIYSMKTNGSSRWQLSDHQWTEDEPHTANSNVPYLVDIYKNGQSSVPSVQTAEQYGGWDPATNTWPAQIGEVLEIVWLNVNNNASYSWDSHPFHAHGGHYYDIGAGNGTYDPVANEEKLKGYNPVKRDTTMLFRYTAGSTKENGDILGWRAWRLRVDDAGVWMIHCHTLQHMLMGMQSVWVMGDAAQIQAKMVTDTGFETNGTNVESSVMDGYLNYGGAAYGNKTHAPQVLHWYP